MITPTKFEYEKALEAVQKYEDRQKELAKLNKDLRYSLTKFDQIKFDANDSKKEVTFTGVTKDGKLRLAKSVARHGDKFELVIGKLIAVKKSLNENVGYIEEFIESERNNIIYAGEYWTYD